MYVVAGLLRRSTKSTYLSPIHAQMDFSLSDTDKLDSIDPARFSQATPHTRAISSNSSL